MSGGTAVKAGYAGGGSPTRRAAQPSCSPPLAGERWGDRHNRPQGSALTAWGAAPPSNGTKPAVRLTMNSFFLRDGSLPGWAKTPLKRLRALLRLEPDPGRSAEALGEGGRDTPKDSRKLESGDSRLRSPVRLGFPLIQTMRGDEMRRPIIAYMDNGLPVQLLSRRDFLFPDADEKYVPPVLAIRAAHRDYHESGDRLEERRSRISLERAVPARSRRNSARPRGFEWAHHCL